MKDFIINNIIGIISVVVAIIFGSKASVNYIKKTKIKSNRNINNVGNGNINNNITNTNIYNDLKTNTKNSVVIDEKGKILLRKAVESNGEIIYIKTLNNENIQSGKDFCIKLGDKNHREVMEWKSSFSNLIDNGFITDKGSKNEVFEVTNLGYQYYDNSINKKKKNYESAESIEHREAIKNFINYNGFNNK